MSTKLTPTELAAKLYALQRALEDATLAREMLAEADGVIARLRTEIGTDNDLIKALFSSEPVVVMKRRRTKGYRHIGRSVWLEPTMQCLKDFRRPATIMEMTPNLKGTPGETTSSILQSRLQRLVREKRIQRIDPPNGDRLGVRYTSVVPVVSSPPATGPIIHRHRGQVDSVTHDHRAVNGSAAR